MSLGAGILLAGGDTSTQARYIAGARNMLIGRFMVKVPTTAFSAAAFIRDAEDVVVYLEGLKKEGARAIALALP